MGWWGAGTRWEVWLGMECELEWGSLGPGVGGWGMEAKGAEPVVRVLSSRGPSVCYMHSVSFQGADATSVQKGCARVTPHTVHKWLR